MPWLHGNFLFEDCACQWSQSIFARHGGGVRSCHLSQLGGSSEPLTTEKTSLGHKIIFPNGGERGFKTLLPRREGGNILTISPGNFSTKWEALCHSWHSDSFTTSLRKKTHNYTDQSAATYCRVAAHIAIVKIHYGPHDYFNDTLQSGKAIFPQFLLQHWLFCFYLWKSPMKLKMIFFLRSPRYPTNKQINIYIYI